jgi:hypothetical protein
LPWYVVASFTVYAGLLIWQATRAVEIGRTGFLAIPYLLIKLTVMFVALGYWDPDFCALLGNRLGGGIIFGGALVLLREAMTTLKPILLTPNHPRELDDLIIVIGVLTAAVAPAIVLIFAGMVVLGHRCAT